MDVKPGIIISSTILFICYEANAKILKTKPDNTLVTKYNGLSVLTMILLES